MNYCLFCITEISVILPIIQYQNLENVLMSLEEDSEMTIYWFENNYMKINADKCHLLALGFQYNVGQWA